MADIVQAFLQNTPPEVVLKGQREESNNATWHKSHVINIRIDLGNDCRHAAMARRGGGYRPALGALATRVKAGVAAILASTSLTGCFVQAWVT
jgi:hypothetical protein